MAKRWVVVLGSMAVLYNGCARYWHQEGRTFEQCKQDRMDCVLSVELHEMIRARRYFRLWPAYSA